MRDEQSSNILPTTSHVHIGKPAITIVSKHEGMGRVVTDARNFRFNPTLSNVCVLIAVPSINSEMFSPVVDIFVDSQLR